MQQQVQVSRLPDQVLDDAAAFFARRGARVWDRTGSGLRFALHGAQSGEGGRVVVAPAAGSTTVTVEADGLSVWAMAESFVRELRKQAKGQARDAARQARSDAAATIRGSFSELRQRLGMPAPERSAEPETEGPRERRPARPPRAPEARPRTPERRARRAEPAETATVAGAPAEAPAPAPDADHRPAGAGANEPGAAPHPAGGPPADDQARGLAEPAPALETLAATPPSPEMAGAVPEPDQVAAGEPSATAAAHSGAGSPAHPPTLDPSKPPPEGPTYGRPQPPAEPPPASS